MKYNLQNGDNGKKNIYDKKKWLEKNFPRKVKIRG